MEQLAASAHLESILVGWGNKGDKALSDLLCKDAEGHNVYLYVSKKE
jgi:hypothetical protein